MPRKPVVRSSKPRYVFSSEEEENEEDVYTSGDEDEENEKDEPVKPKDDGDESDALVDSSEDESDARPAAPAPPPQPVVVARPVVPNVDTRFMYRKHKCLQAMVAMPRNLAGADACSPDKPAELKIDKVKFHYIIHYIHRGYWNGAVPELTDEEKPTIAAYQCNICKKSFRNNLSKKEYPARGTFLCHLATEHGKIVEAMREDSEVDMTSVIELLAQNDPAFKSFVDAGTKTPHDDDIVTIKKDVFYNYTMLNASRQNATAPTPAPTSAPVIPEDTRYLSCPKCSDSSLKKNSEPQALKVHLLHQHYRNKWDEKLDSAPRDSDTLYYCELCPTRRKFTGKGARGALLVHWAVQEHDQLKDVLAQDKDISEKFINRLYRVRPGDATSVNSSTSTPAQANSQHRVVEANKPTSYNSNNNNNNNNSKRYSPPKKAAPLKKRSKDDEDEMTDESTTSEDDDAVESMYAKSNKKMSKTKSKPVSVAPTPTYIRKRPKMNLRMEDMEEDSDEWSEDESGASKSSKKKAAKATGGGGTPIVDEASRGRPRRAAAVNRKSFVEVASEDSDDE